MEKTLQEKQGVSNENLMEMLIDQRVNERFAQMKAELGEELAYFNQRQSASVDGEPFYRIQSYISTLVQVQSADHNVHKELDEAISKLKELAYNERA